MGLETLAALGMAAGAGAGIFGSVSEKQAMEDKVKDELFRQRAFQKQATGEFDKSLSQEGAANAQAQTQQGADRLAAEYAKLAAVPLTANSPSDPSATIPMTATSRAATQGAVDLSNRTAAQAGGWSEWQMNQAIKNILANTHLNTIARQAQISAQPLPAEIQQASTSWDWLKTLGNLGSMASMLAAMNGMKPAAGSGGSTSFGDPSSMNFVTGSPDATLVWEGGMGDAASPF